MTTTPVADILGDLFDSLAEALTHAASQLSGTDVEVDEFESAGYEETHRVKRARILIDVKAAGGAVSPETLSEFAVRHGIKPQGTAGYFVGPKPSMVSDKTKGLRVLTEHGEAQIMEAMTRWPEHFSAR